MYLERIDIDQQGPLQRVQLGPFSPKLNAVLGPSGSGKTTVLRFLREMMQGDRRLSNLADPQRGRVVWAARDGLWHCVRDSDGRYSTQLEPRGGRSLSSQPASHTGFETWSPAIIDGIVTTSNHQSILSAVVAAQRAGLDTTVMAAPTHYGEITRLERRIAELDRLLADLEPDAEPIPGLERRRTELIAELAQIDRLAAEQEQCAEHDAQRLRLLECEADVDSDIRRLREQEVELRRVLAEIDAELKADAGVPRVDSTRRAIAETHRRQLEDLDGQLLRWGRTLRDIRQLRDRLDADLQHESGCRCGATPEQESLHALEARLEATQREIDHLVRHRSEMLKRIATEHHVSHEQIEATFGDWRQCQDHPHLYEWLLSEGCSAQWCDRDAHERRIARLENDRTETARELDGTLNRLETSLTELRRLRSERARLPERTPRPQLRERAAIVRELDHVRDLLARDTRRGDYLRQRETCLQQIARLRRPVTTHQSSLAPRASHWLQRLSGGRYQDIRWRGAEPTVAGTHYEPAIGQGISIDGRSDNYLPNDDRYIAALAIRLAAVDELARRGHGVPLLIETPSLLDSLSQTTVRYDDGYGEYRHEYSAALPRWLETVLDFADAGHQTILLTRSRQVADRVSLRGGTIHHLRSQGHRTVIQPSAPRYAPLDINRDLDMAWREAYIGFAADPAPRTTTPPLEVYSAYPNPENFSARRYEPAASAGPADTSPRRDAAPSPFFLTADSPVDQAPSVDAVAAARLRDVGMSRIGQLMAADPARLADSLGMPQVDEHAVRRWQNEARLMCRVPQLRAFDARVLVGCGITDPKRLAGMHPGELLEKVEAFFATERGRQILRSGSSSELSRITSWIAAANRSVAREGRHGRRAPRHQNSPSTNNNRASASLSGAPRPAAEADRFAPAARDAEGFDRSGYDGTQDRPAGSSRSRKERLRSQRRRRRSSESGQRHEIAQDVVSMSPRATEETEVASATSGTERQWRFYLERKSPIVDAPTIGPRTANKLEKIGLYTVDDLLTADAEQVAMELNNRRIDGEEVRSWQRQSALVCRIPMLRGHDAQLLVAAGIYEPEQLIGYDPQTLLSEITAVVDTTAGKRILRGSDAPDLEEITAWIEYAGHHRELRAA
ncbi:DUF4332 domain-containing protein [Roseimaritima sediminicola]|uniref:DUF4332 domain-containing protein n=1 Tax=Roseimaritima sediminicola TaxID=2662066 RepID=UPI001298390B|nr:DUF4332 domain-containing protein [Roseimaritima sediminicola]